MLEGLFGRALERRAMVGRHHHHDIRAKRFRQFGPLHRDLGGVVRDRDNHRHAACHMLKRETGEHVALCVCQQELLREVGENTDAIGTLVDQALENALHAVQIKRAIGVERGRGDRPDAGVLGHDVRSFIRM